MPVSNSLAGRDQGVNQGLRVIQLNALYWHSVIDTNLVQDHPLEPETRDFGSASIATEPVPAPPYEASGGHNTGYLRAHAS